MQYWSKICTVLPLYIIVLSDSSYKVRVLLCSELRVFSEFLAMVDDIIAGDG